MTPEGSHILLLISDVSYINDNGSAMKYCAQKDLGEIPYL